MRLFLESERIVSRSSHSQGVHAYRHSSCIGRSGLGWCLVTNVCTLSVGTIPNNFWFPTDLASFKAVVRQQHDGWRCRFENVNDEEYFVIREQWPVGLHLCRAAEAFFFNFLLCRFPTKPLDRKLSNKTQIPMLETTIRSNSELVKCHRTDLASTHCNGLSPSCRSCPF
jgi:hypothetical protein